MKGILLAIVIIGRAYCEVVEDVDDTPMEEVYEDDSDSPSIDFSSLTPLPLDGSSSSGSSVLKPDIQAQNTQFCLASGSGCSSSDRVGRFFKNSGDGVCARSLACPGEGYSTLKECKANCE
eukprot:TRINITY_DN5448_c0_g1_i3.p2 TRINITY_DN5448_c0_g1~~TRINITY_DN5448_c0_g1_i3.p2  ORF type:complete len:139 (-),score=10.17 TRINITY_DN5448_c0_g1_i3:529-891(-)